MDTQPRVFGHTRTGTTTQSLENQTYLIFRYCKEKGLPMPEETFENYARRKEDTNALIDDATRFGSLDDFLSELALVTNLEAEEARASGEEDAIRLSTIHQAKGLEFEIVFVPWLTEGMFPSGRAIDDDPSASEERRLFYVVTTRAKDELYLLIPEYRRKRDGSTQVFDPSRFIEELDEDLVEKCEPGYFHTL